MKRRCRLLRLYQMNLWRHFFSLFHSIATFHVIVVYCRLHPLQVPEVNFKWDPDQILWCLAMPVAEARCFLQLVQTTFESSTYTENFILQIRRAPSEDSITSHQPKRFFFFNFYNFPAAAVAEKDTVKLLWEWSALWNDLPTFPTLSINKSSVHSHPAEVHFSLIIDVPVLQFHVFKSV